MEDRDALIQALELAENRKGFTAPNPSVGAVLVKNGEVIASANHERAGAPHAELALMEKVGDDVREGATVYVTLEPCCHWGKTPPCTQLLIANRVKRVVYAHRDPNPLVAGKGHRELEEAGIEVKRVEVKEIERFYEPYDRWVLKKRPYVIAKLAMSLDGKIAAAGGVPISLSQEALNEFTHSMRRRSDAILTTAQTVIADDPRLNARIDGEDVAKPLYIVDSKLRFPLKAKVFQTAQSITVIHSPKVDRVKKAEYESRGVRFLEVAEDPKGVHIDGALEAIANDGVQDLWVEAGGTFFQSLAEKKLIQRTFLYVCPTWLGSRGKEAFDTAGADLFAKVQRVHWIPFGRDSLCEVTW